MTLPEELSLNAWVPQKSLERIEDHLNTEREQPFMLWAGLWDPHPPFRAQDEWDRLYASEAMPDRVKTSTEIAKFPPLMREYMRPECDADWKEMTAKYMAMISHLDDQFGKLLAGLEDMGVLENTIILFTSDHGEMLGAHHCMGKGVYFYDDALKVPCVIASASAIGTMASYLTSGRTPKVW